MIDSHDRAEAQLASMAATVKQYNADVKGILKTMVGDACQSKSEYSLKLRESIKAQEVEVNKRRKALILDTIAAVFSII